MNSLSRSQLTPLEIDLPKALDALLAALGDSASIQTDATSLKTASIDSSRFSRMPSAVIRVFRHEAVGVTLAIANRFGVPVTARGAGSATTGSAVPSAEGWVIDLSPLKHVEIDPLNRFAHVGAGAIIAAINEAAEEHGLFYPPDPSSKAYATIGGTIATNAGGLRGAKYGVTRDYIVALSGYLPTGQPVDFGRPLRKFVSGFNLRDLWIGAEGMLGIATSATLRLIPKPQSRWTCLAGFADESSAIQTVRTLLARRIQPSILEFLDRQTTTCTEKLIGRPFFDSFPGGAILLIECDGHAESVKSEAEVIREILQSRDVPMRETSNPDDAEQLWNVRRLCSRAMFQLGDTKLNEDVVVPLDAYDQLIQATLQIQRTTGLATPTFGHAADGNFHVHIMYDHAVPDQAQQAGIALTQLMKFVVDVGGAITGEHGIGLAKSPFFSLQHSAAEIEAMRAIKRALDPNNILNPDKTFTPTKLWNEPRDRGHIFPWDH